MKTIEKFVHALRGTYAPHPRPLPEYRYTVMLISILDEQEYYAHAIEWHGAAPVVQILAKEGELTDTVDKALKASEKGQYVMVLDSWDGKRHMLRAA